GSSPGGSRAAGPAGADVLPAAAARTGLGDPRRDRGILSSEARALRPHAGNRFAGSPAGRGDRRPGPGPAAPPRGAPRAGQRRTGGTPGRGTAAAPQLVRGTRPRQAADPGGPGLL